MSWSAEYNFKIFIRIGHDNTGFMGGTWFLDHVDVYSTSMDKTWSFAHGRWLGKDVDDGELERVLNRQVLVSSEPNVKNTEPDRKVMSDMNQTVSSTDEAYQQGKWFKKN